MKKIILFYLCFIVLPVFAQNATPFCTGMTTRVHVKTLPGNPQYITTYSRSDFLKKAGGKFSPHTLGLTVAKLDITAAAKPEVSQQNGRYCVKLSDLEITMQYPSILVYIDKKYMPSSCEYRIIKEHEQYHVQVSQQALTFFKPDVERVVSEALNSLSPKVVSAQTEVQSALRQMTDSVLSQLRPLVAHINNKLSEKNAAIDTPESYTATTAKCSNW